MIEFISKEKGIKVIHTDRTGKIFDVGLLKTKTLRTKK